MYCKQKHFYWIYIILKIIKEPLRAAKETFTMLKILADKWGKNKDKLQKVFAEGKEFCNCNYKKIVETVFNVIYNDEDSVKELNVLNTRAMTEIDDGDYQGTLVYLIPFETYQPSAGDYLMTYIGYGSCSCCDTLLAIQSENGYDTEYLTKEQVSSYMQLAAHILQNTVKPYNEGWRADERFTQIEVAEE